MPVGLHENLGHSATDETIAPKEKTVIEDGIDGGVVESKIPNELVTETKPKTWIQRFRSWLQSWSRSSQSSAHKPLQVESSDAQEASNDLLEFLTEIRNAETLPEALVCILMNGFRFIECVRKNVDSFVDRIAKDKILYQRLCFFSYFIPTFGEALRDILREAKSDLKHAVLKDQIDTLLTDLQRNTQSLHSLKEVCADMLASLHDIEVDSSWTAAEAEPSTNANRIQTAEAHIARIMQKIATITPQLFAIGQCVGRHESDIGSFSDEMRTMMMKLFSVSALVQHLLDSEGDQDDALSELQAGQQVHSESLKAISERLNRLLRTFYDEVPQLTRVVPQLVERAHLSEENLAWLLQAFEEAMQRITVVSAENTEIHGRLEQQEWDTTNLEVRFEALSSRMNSLFTEVGELIAQLSSSTNKKVEVVSEAVKAMQDYLLHLESRTDERFASLQSELFDMNQRMTAMESALQEANKRAAAAEREAAIARQEAKSLRTQLEGQSEALQAMAAKLGSLESKLPSPPPSHPHQAHQTQSYWTTDPSAYSSVESCSDPQQLALLLSNSTTAIDTKKQERDTLCAAVPKNTRAIHSLDRDIRILRRRRLKIINRHNQLVNASRAQHQQLQQHAPLAPGYSL